jgi:hypothetical protein
MEEIVAIITRAVQKGWHPIVSKGNVIVFSSAGRIFLLPTYSALKGMALSQLIPIVGDVYCIKKLREEDKMVENISIPLCEEKAERIIAKEEIETVKAESHWGIRGLGIHLKSGEHLYFGTLDQQGMTKALEYYSK